MNQYHNEHREFHEIGFTWKNMLCMVGNEISCYSKHFFLDITIENL